MSTPPPQRLSQGLPIEAPFSDVRELVWIQTSYIGDVVLTTAALRLAAQKLPGVRQHLVTTPAGHAALRGLSCLASTTIFHKGEGGALKAFAKVKKALAREVKDGAKVVTMLAHRSHRSALLAKSLGYRTIGYEEGAWSFLADRRVPRVAVLHEAARIGLLLAPLGIAREEILAARPWLPQEALRDDAPWASGLAAEGGLWVGLAPGSVWGTKRWTIAGYRDLARRLLAQSDVKLVLIGSAAEAAQCRAIFEDLGEDAQGRVFDVAGQTSLGDLRAVLPRLDVLVSGDSSPVHFAAALGVPTVAIFGATVPEMGFAPLAPDSVSLGVSLPCRPCSDHGPMECPLSHFQCMRGLAADVVYDAVCERLKKRRAVS